MSFWRSGALRLTCFANAPAPYRGRNPKKIGKRGFRGQKPPISPLPQKRAIWVPIWISLQGSTRKMGIFDRKRGVFVPRNPVPDFGDFDPYRGRARSQNLLGPETSRWGGGLTRETFVPSLESLSSLGFEERKESGMSQEFCRDVPDPWGCSELSGVIRANRFARFARIGWFAPIGNSSDSCESAWRAIKIGGSIANDSRESICANRVANRPCH